MNCKVCGKKCQGEYCCFHKPRKGLRRKSLCKSSSCKVKNNEEHEKMIQWFKALWYKNNQKHYCEECGVWLGNEPHSYNFDHILEKQSFPELKYVEENIQFLCWACHNKKSMGYLTEKVREKIAYVKENVLPLIRI